MHTRRMARGKPLPPFAKYLLLELPGWAIGSVVLALLAKTDSLSWRIAGLLLALWVAKDFALYPVLRIAYEHGTPDGTGSLIGALGVAREPLDPEGYVAVGSELWRARVTADAAPVETGAKVRVLEVRNLLLLVEQA